MRTIIAGSRAITDYGALISAINKAPFPVSHVVSGTARGVDSLGERYAKESGIPCRRFPANWGLHGKMAGFLRNDEMARNADALIAIWDGQSKGTAHMIDTARKRGLAVHVETLTGVR